MNNKNFAEYPVLRKTQIFSPRQKNVFSEKYKVVLRIYLELDEFLIRNLYLNNFLIDSCQKLLLNSLEKHSIMYKDFAELGILRKLQK